MNNFHLAERPEVAAAIKAADACNTIDELETAIGSYKGHDLARLRPHLRSKLASRQVNGGNLMIIVEKPETEDDLDASEPLSGNNGKLMREVMGWYGLDLDLVHVCYAIHWTPENERSVNATQIAASRPFLFREIELIKPRAILIPGRAVLEATHMIRQPITPMLGMSIDWKRGDLQIPCSIVWHPAWPLRFRSDIPEYGAQIETWVERNGNADGTPYERLAAKNPYERERITKPHPLAA